MNCLRCITTFFILSCLASYSLVAQDTTQTIKVRKATEQRSTTNYPQTDLFIEAEEYIEEKELLPVYHTVNINKERALPEYPGGIEAIRVFLKENLQYPQAVKEQGIYGYVHVTLRYTKQYGKDEISKEINSWGLYVKDKKKYHAPVPELKTEAERIVNEASKKISIDWKSNQYIDVHKLDQINEYYFKINFIL